MERLCGSTRTCTFLVHALSSCTPRIVADGADTPGRAPHVRLTKSDFVSDFDACLTALRPRDAFAAEPAYTRYVSCGYAVRKSPSGHMFILRCHAAGRNQLR